MKSRASLLATSLVVLLFGTVPQVHAQQSSSQPARTTLLIDTDDACHLTMDDQDEGMIMPAQPKKLKVEMGNHLVKCVIENEPDLTWRKIVELKSSEQVVAMITLKALHIQYDQAMAKPQQSQNRAAAVREATSGASSSAPNQNFQSWMVSCPSTKNVNPADLQRIFQSSNVLTVIRDFSAGGEKARMTFIALCLATFPEVVGKIVDVRKSDKYVDFMVFTGATPTEMNAATTPNMDVRVWTSAPPQEVLNLASANHVIVQAQPEVIRLQKDDGIRFRGTLVGFDSSPVNLHWDAVKVDPTVIPAAVVTQHPNGIMSAQREKTVDYCTTHPNGAVRVSDGGRVSCSGWFKEGTPPAVPDN